MSDLPSPARHLVVVGCGGTIAGRSVRPGDHLGYRAGEIEVQTLLEGLPRPAGFEVRADPFVQIDSKDMDFATWRGLARRVAAHLGQPQVAGVVVTHGTDTLEETAYFLHRMVSAHKPVVLTAAMRPASAPSPDGPQNLVDAMQVASTEGAFGVVAALHGRIVGAADLRKVHGYRVDAFDSGDAGPIGVVEDGQLRRFRAWPEAPLHAATRVAALPAAAPWVEIITSTADAQPRTIDALVAAGVQGLVIAGTGNGTWHRAWADALTRAAAAGVALRLASRCALGGVVGSMAGGVFGSGVSPAASAGARTAAQARVELMLDLIVKAEAGRTE